MIKRYSWKKVILIVMIWIWIVLSSVLCVYFYMNYRDRAESFSEYKRGYVAGKIDAYKEINEYMKKHSNQLQ